MADNEIKVPIEIDATKLEQSLLRIEKSLDGFSNKTEKSLSKVSLSFSNFIGSFAANTATKAVDSISSSIKDFFSGVISESVNAQNVMVKLNSALLSTGEATKENIKLFDEFAKTIQSTTKFEDDLVKEQVAVAKAAGLSNEATKQLITAATDYAAVTGKDLPSAVEGLILSLNGQGRSLKVLGPEFANLTQEQLKSGAAIDLIAKKFSSAAENETKTFAGAIASLKNSYGNLQEEVGNTIVQNESFSNLISAAKSFVDRLTDSISRNSKSFDIVTDSIKFTLEQFSSFLRGVDLLIKGFNTLKNVVFSIGNLFGVLVSYLGKGFIAVSDFTASLFGLSGIFDKLKRNFDFLNNGFKDSLSKNIDALSAKSEKTIFGKASDEVKKLSTDITKGIEQDNKGLNNLTNTASKFKDVFNKLDTPKGLSKSLDDQNKILNQQLEIYKKINEEIKVGASNPLQGIFGSTDLQRQLKKDLQDKTLTPEQRKFSSDSLDQAQKNANIGGIAGVGQSILGGAQGASKLIAGGIGLAANAAIPGLGEVVGPIAETLFAGPEAVKALVKGFTDAIPDIIMALVEAVPAVIDELVAQLPVLINKLVEDLPILIESLAESMPRVAIELGLAMPQVAISFAMALIGQAPKIAAELIKAASGYNTVKKLFHFAGGGIVGGNSFTGDNVNAKINSGEMVLTRSQQSNLFEIANGKKSSRNDSQIIDAINMLSNQIMGQPIIVQVDGREIARATRNQIRQGFVI